MAINENVYGSPNTWIDCFTNDSTIFKGAKRPSWQTLYDGVVADKIATQNLIDQSIGYIALGAESPYSDLITVFPDQTINHSTRNKTDFFYGYNSGSYNYCFRGSRYNIDSWNVSTLDIYENTNCNKSIIVSMDLKYLLWVVRVCVASTEHPIGVGDLANYYLYDYANDPAKQAQFPYLITAYMCAAYEQNTPENPNRYFDLSTVTTHPITLCLNCVHPIASHDDFITYNDCNSTTPWLDRGDNILLRGSSNNTGSSIFDGYNSVYVLGDENYIKWQYGNFNYAEPYTEDVKNEIIKAAACFCNFFIGDTAPTSPYTITNVPLNDQSVYLGFPDEDFISHGEFTRGADNEQNPLWEWETTRDSEYDYTYEPPIYDNTQFGTGFISSAFTKFYALDLIGVGQLSNKLFTFLENRDPDIPIDVFLPDNFLSTNPLDLVVSLKKMPFSIPGIIAMSSDTVSIGKMTTTINCKSTTGAVLSILNFGQTRVPSHYQDFRDYEPYTTYELIVPFCGSIKLNAAEVVGKTMILKMAVDPFTGDCTCYILVEGKIIESLSGNCAIDLPIAGEQSATLTNAIANARTNVYNAKLSSKQMTQSAQYSIFSTLGNSALSMFGSGKSMTKLTNYTGVGSALLSAGGTAVNAIHGAENAGVEIGKAEYDLSHTVIPIKSIGGQSGVTNLLQPMTADLLIERCVMLEYDPEVYAQTTGFACLLNGTVSDFSGLTVGNIVLDGVSCSLTEKELIKKAFATGVYL